MRNERNETANTADLIAVKTSTKDVIWSYVCAVLTPISGFLLLPILLLFLSDAEIGLWYVFIAISGWPALLFLGLSPAFSRNIVYCLSGARALSKSGLVEYDRGGQVNWHLLKCVMKTSKLFYALISVATLALLVAAGTAYVIMITDGSGLAASTRNVSWIIFIFAMVLNVYFQYADVYLRGFGDIAATSRAQVLAKVSQLIITPVLLLMDWGFIGAACGFFLNSVVYRLLTAIYARKHRTIYNAVQADSAKIGFAAIKNTFFAIFHLAWRDGIVMVSMYVATQVSTLICSAFLSLDEAGSYAISLQFANAICSFASAYASSSYPEFQAAYTQRNSRREREIVGACSVAYWTACIVCIAGVTVVALPVLTVIKPEYTYDTGLFVMLGIYSMLLNHHSMHCSFIMCMNNMPYMLSYLVSAVIGLALSVAMVMWLGIGVWGLVLGQGIAQLAFNNWYWPRYVADKLQSSYRSLLGLGFETLRKRIARRD